MTKSEDQQTIAGPQPQSHDHSQDRNPHRLQPSAFVSSHVPTQQSHEETRHESHRPLADQERSVNSLELLVQEMEERVVGYGRVILI
jgi:hypothetical protein